MGSLVLQRGWIIYVHDNLDFLYTVAKHFKPIAFKCSQLLVEMPFIIININKRIYYIFQGKQM